MFQRYPRKTHSHLNSKLDLPFSQQSKNVILTLFNKVKNLIFINENIYSRFEIYLTSFM